MTTMIIKSRARRPLITGKAAAGWRRYGVGGMPESHAACVSLHVGEYQIYITELEWREIVETVSKMIAENPA